MSGRRCVPLAVRGVNLVFRMIIGRVSAIIGAAIVGIRVPAEGAATGMWLKDGPHVRVFWLAALWPVVDTWDGLTVGEGLGRSRERSRATMISSWGGRPPRPMS
jgi:hypothetical protein